MSIFWQMMKVLLVLALVLLVAVYTLKLVLARIEPGRGRGETLKVLERLPVSQRSHLLLVSAGQKRLLLGVSTEQINLLAELEEEASPDTSREFNEVLSRSLLEAGSKPSGHLKNRIAFWLRNIAASLEGQLDNDEDE